ncbi:hypothetical protein [cf. Phormidesmis sp. LEGE 11477]|uniref:hypothetical protein n=1 Tax=cf. Phormidesmis sp. LEGE 11477 TaxID=1828680 RepID=UPI00188058A3|nr:hypothetical protein [cf. Phormidesmis sp. LEGE 11477]MBE9064279.1 hypothetical protein [cf. Phormidesmis sp. LEGE 11477]
MAQISTLDQVLESIETLSVEDQELLVKLMHQRLVERRRDEIAENIAQAKKDYKSGQVFSGTVDEVMAELRS